MKTSELMEWLNYLHSRVKERPAYHRDVKSANIVLTESLEAKLIDCGLAKYIPSDLSTASVTKIGQLLIWVARDLDAPAYICFDGRSSIRQQGLHVPEIFRHWTIRRESGSIFLRHRAAGVA